MQEENREINLLQEPLGFGIVFQVVEGLIPLWETNRETDKKNRVKVYLGSPAKFIVLDQIERTWYYVLSVGMEDAPHGYMNLSWNDVRGVKIKKIG